MRFKDFRMLNVLNFAIPDSSFFNKRIINYQQRMFVYFENYFSDNKTDMALYDMMQRTSHNRFNLNPTVLKKINLFSDYINDESDINNFQPRSINLEINDKNNKKLARFLTSCQLLSVYVARAINGSPAAFADEAFTKLFYRLASHYDVLDLLDKVIYYKGNYHSQDEKKEIDNGIPITATEWKQKHGIGDDEVKIDYDFNKNKEIALIQTVLTTKPVVRFQSSSLINLLGNDYSGRLEHDSYEFLEKGKCEIYKKLKKMIIDINILSDQFINKDKIIDSISKLINSKEFEDVREYNNMNAVLNYYDERPLYKSEELMEKYKDNKKYKFKGVVYHGFKNRGGYTNNPVEVISRYENGFISCSKDIQIASNFADDNGGSFGGVIEIYIDDDIEALDIEKILKDGYDASQSKYKFLYDSFIHEQEVLVKMPINKFRYLTPDRVAEMIANKKIMDNEYLSTYKKKSIKSE